MSRAIFCGLLQDHEEPLRWRAVASSTRARPVFHRELGETLKRLREKEGWSVQQAIIRAKAKHHTALTANRLRWIEEGKTKFPDADVLSAIAEIYGIAYVGLAASFVSANYGRDLLGHSPPVQSGSHPHQGESDGPAQTRIRELQDRVDQLERLVPEIEDVLVKLANVAGDSVVVRKAGKPQPRKSGNRTKTA